MLCAVLPPRHSGQPGTAVASSFFASSPTTEALVLDYPRKRLASQEQMDLHG